MENEDKKNRVVNLFKEHSKSKAPRRRKATSSGNTVNISGNGNAVGQIVGGDVHNHHYPATPRAPKVVVTPAGDVITEAQKVALRQLRDEWIDLHNAIKKRPLTQAAAQKRINDKALVTSYHLIPANQYDGLVRWIKQQMGRLRNMPSAAAKDDGWRAAKIGAIKARCKNQLGDDKAYVDYIKKNFGQSSLSALATDQLQRTYAYIMSKKV
ncbi:hypothetical protein [Methylogaea oryzae]|uniref:Uncharacterized protein n=1 Tax=Methylogaea oryzae TaxID=1295382 RepID=A0A8D4VMT0_9GAMM|nr:hypothetical protein [Methylogaea oryzae]BBL70372.1 hypothetical protein MoryE10_09780 [Methylogaea oryzae]